MDLILTELLAPWRGLSGQTSCTEPDCQDCLLLIAAYREGTILPAEKVALETHTADCEVCETVLSDPLPALPISYCNDVRPLIVLAVNGDATREEAREVAAHVAQCPRCARIERELRARLDAA